MSNIFKNVLEPNNNNKKSTPTQEVLFNSDTTNKALKESQSTNILDTSSVSRIVHQDEPNIQYRLFRNKLFKCFNIEDELFTNLLPSEFYEIESYIEEGLKALQNTPSLISMSKQKVPASQVYYRGEFKEHIKNIVGFYDKDYDCDGQLVDSLLDGFIWKSKIESPLGDSGALRLISLYSKDLETGSNYMDLLFVDFYHLFIPSRHKQKSANVTRQNIYLQKRNRNAQVSEKYFSSLII